MKNIRLIPALTVCLMLVLPASAADLQKGLDAADRNDYATALKEWRPLAERGDAAAQTFLGVMYATGEGVRENNAIAYMWFNIAASQGDKGAVSNLDKIKQQMTPSQVEKGQDLTRQCIAKNYKGC